MTGLLKIFVYLCVGEWLVQLTGFPMPGPVVGLVVMLADFLLRGAVDGDVARIFDVASPHLTLLFIPAGAGIAAHADLLGTGLLAIVAAILGGTLATMLVTAFVFRMLLAKGDVASADSQAAQSLLEVER